MGRKRKRRKEERKKEEKEEEGEGREEEGKKKEEEGGKRKMRWTNQRFWIFRIFFFSSSSSCFSSCSSCCSRFMATSKPLKSRSSQGGLAVELFTRTVLTTMAFADLSVDLYASSSSTSGTPNLRFVTDYVRWRAEDPYFVRTTRFDLTTYIP